MKSDVIFLYLLWIISTALFYQNVKEGFQLYDVIKNSNESEFQDARHKNTILLSYLILSILLIVMCLLCILVFHFSTRTESFRMNLYILTILVVVSTGIVYLTTVLQFRNTQVPIQGLVYIVNLLRNLSYTIGFMLITGIVLFLFYRNISKPKDINLN